MTQETETASPAAGRNVGDVSDAKISLASETRESNSSNGVQGRVQGGHSVRMSGYRTKHVRVHAHTLSCHDVARTDVIITIEQY